MPLSEFELINRFFRRSDVPNNASVATGIGDDCAVLNVPVGEQLLVSTDTLVEGVHFPEGAFPCELAYRCIAVNVSDIVAMGGEPQWLSLALTLPKADVAWIESFSIGFFEAADDFGVQLIGGDTTRGPLSITITVHGFVPSGLALLRSGARVGDDIYVSGVLGDAAAALHQIQNNPQESTHCSQLTRQFYRPQPPVKLAVVLRGLASACIDVSDGLLADLKHVLTASDVGAELTLDSIPLSDALKKYCNHHGLNATELACTGGDDYQICFTVPSALEGELKGRLEAIDMPVNKVGRIVFGQGLKCFDSHGSEKAMTRTGYQHFK
ncbi:MAG: thiamine-phosphate kinase [Gammaproteobacteria bacterium]|nr:MAG: thiamine-phosphate kinase [Gammaproteobacteria bacterium]